MAGALHAVDLEKAAQTAIESLRALGYTDMHLDFAVKGVCADCATGAASASANAGPAA
uniref:Uncharacterized protein n=1 Tax=Curvibacter symbiont subsp. Hydra magnipapillata TaxID=667019 RepID=C9YH06_CURXX|nr:hypothetical protein Csp_B20560 [Curvibacter putative symbiont of Hydra magnipapillata]